MLRPIRRVWVPPKPMPSAPAAPAVDAGPLPPPAAAPRQVFGVLPETEVEERDSDSIWAEFDSVYAKSAANKRGTP